VVNYAVDDDADNVGLAHRAMQGIFNLDYDKMHIIECSVSRERHLNPNPTIISYHKADDDPTPAPSTDTRFEEKFQDLQRSLGIGVDMSKIRPRTALVRASTSVQNPMYVRLWAHSVRRRGFAMKVPELHNTVPDHVLRARSRRYVRVFGPNSQKVSTLGPLIDNSQYVCHVQILKKGHIEMHTGDLLSDTAGAFVFATNTGSKVTCVIDDWKTIENAVTTIDPRGLSNGELCLAKRAMGRIVRTGNMEAFTNFLDSILKDAGMSTDDVLLAALSAVMEELHDGRSEVNAKMRLECRAAALVLVADSFFAMPPKKLVTAAKRAILAVAAQIPQRANVPRRRLPPAAERNTLVSGDTPLVGKMHLFMALEDSYISGIMLPRMYDHNHLGCVVHASTTYPTEPVEQKKVWWMHLDGSLLDETCCWRQPIEHSLLACAALIGGKDVIEEAFCVCNSSNAELVECKDFIVQRIVER